MCVSIGDGLVAACWSLSDRATGRRPNSRTRPRLPGSKKIINHPDSLSSCYKLAGASVAKLRAKIIYHDGMLTFLLILLRRRSCEILYPQRAIKFGQPIYPVRRNWPRASDFASILPSWKIVQEEKIRPDLATKNSIGKINEIVWKLCNPLLWAVALVANQSRNISVAVEGADLHNVAIDTAPVRMYTFHSTFSSPAFNKPLHRSLHSRSKFLGIRATLHPSSSCGCNLSAALCICNGKNRTAQPELVSFSPGIKSIYKFTCYSQVVV